ncbi:MAG: aldo/keto reductase [Actinobacteria bacterium]|nr:aldo/keto reductase [Actinomycetota bacterium]
MHTVMVRGVQVPSLGFGTFQLEGDDCERGVSTALEVGYRHIDTAQMYGNEDRVGAALAASGVDRGDIFLTTKLDNDAHAPDDVRSTTEDSLRKLQTEYVDLLLIHWPVGGVPFETTLDAMLELRDEGKVRHVGVSNFITEQIERAVAHAPIFANQVEYHPFLGQEEMRKLAERHDFLLTAYSPLARGEVFDDATLRDVATAHDADPAQVVLAWLVHQERVAAIPKATSPEHIESNFAALDIELSDEEAERISGLARGQRLIDPPFAPWDDENAR